MSDLVERLRKPIKSDYQGDGDWRDERDPLRVEAADRIAELERELAEARADQAKLDAIVHELGIEDSFDEPVDRLRSVIEAERTARLAAEADCAALVEAIEPFRTAAAQESPNDPPLAAWHALSKALASHGTRGKALLVVVEAAKKVDWEASVDARDTLHKALAALDKG